MHPEFAASGKWSVIGSAIEVEQATAINTKPESETQRLKQKEVMGELKLSEGGASSGSCATTHCQAMVVAYALDYARCTLEPEFDKGTRILVPAHASGRLRNTISCGILTGS